VWPVRPKSYLPRRFAFRAAFRCAFADFFIAFCCFLDAFFNNLFCCFADFLDASVDARAYSATPGLCALAGTDHAVFKVISNAKTAIRFTGNSSLSARTPLVYTRLAHPLHCDAIFIRSVPGSS
jgi:hypothetical protein